MTKHSDFLPPFSEDEFFRAYSVFLSRAEARRAAKQMVRQIADAQARRDQRSIDLPGAPGTSGDVPGHMAYGVVMMPDLLATLSLLDRETEIKVAAYRSRLRIDTEDQSGWDRLRSELAPLVRERLGADK